MQRFQHNFPSLRIHYGEGCIDELPRELARLGRKRAVVFSGRSLARDPLGVPRLREKLGDLLVGVFDSVESHSPVPSIERAAAALRDCNADSIVALGGGSSVVSARAAAILFGEERPLSELTSNVIPGKPLVSPKLVAPKLPIFCVPTTPTTGCAKAGTAVLDPAAKRRMTMFDPKTRAAALFVDPTLVAVTPKALMMDASLHSFSMGIQGLESPRGDVFADAALIHGLRIIIDNLPRLTHSSDDVEARGNLVLAAILIGEATNHTGGGLVSVLGHCLGSRTHVGNGLINAVMLPHTIRFNLPQTAKRLTLLADLLKVSDTDGIPDACARFFESNGLPTRLRDIDVSEDVFQTVIEDAFGDWFLYQNPRKVTSGEEISALLQAAY